MINLIVRHNPWEEPVEKVQEARHLLETALEQFDKNDWDGFLHTVRVVKELLQDF
jgi:hypothetical protein